MSERVVEMIEALQEKWMERAKSDLRFSIERVSALCANELAPVLAAVREQGSAFCRQAADITNLRMELAAMKEQHSADLLAIAEMTIGRYTEGRFPAEVVSKGAASILREFREKKSKGGDAQ